MSVFLCAGRVCIKNLIHKAGWCVIKCDYSRSLCVSFLRSLAHTHTHTATLRRQVSSPFLGFLRSLWLWWLMGNFVHAWAHKGSLSAACMLDLSQFIAPLCAPVTSRWPGVSPGGQRFNRVPVSNFLLATESLSPRCQICPAICPRSLLLLLGPNSNLQGLGVEWQDPPANGLTCQLGSKASGTQ